MSDEERKAIDLLKNIDKQKCLMLECPVVKNNIKRQLEIIKLKRKCRELIYEKQQLTSALLDSTPNDKIKAKIEPVLKQLERKMKKEYDKYGNSREYQDIVDAYNFLQSLLEKE